MKRIPRKRPLTPRQARKYAAIRRQVAGELPDLVRRHNERAALHADLRQVLVRLRAARKARGLSLADLTRLTGMDRSALSKLETGQRPNPTVETLQRYAEALGKQLVVTLAEPNSH